MQRIRNMLLVVLVLSAGLVSNARPVFSLGSLPTDTQGIAIIKPPVNPFTGEPDVGGQSLPHASTTKTGIMRSPVGGESVGSVKTILRLAIGRIWAVLYLRAGI